MKKAIILISVGILNLLHGMLHIVQFIQSLLLVSYSIETHNHDNESWIQHFLHNPFFAFFWAIIGVLTFIIGIKDYRHHKKCDHKEIEKNN
jgi:hypothetical protein